MQLLSPYVEQYMDIIGGKTDAEYSLEVDSSRGHKIYLDCSNVYL